MREQALKAGYDEYLPKPTDPGRFLSDIEKLLRRFEPQKAAKPARAKKA